VCLSRVGWDVLTVVAVLELGGWDSPELMKQSPVVEPVDPFEGGELEVVEASPGSAVADESVL
jgi:hypothetical protein